MANRVFLVGLGRAFGGALIFSLPMLMTMEMWWLGFSNAILEARSVLGDDHTALDRSLPLYGF
jgi:hypothetical protein